MKARKGEEGLQVRGKQWLFRSLRDYKENKIISGLFFKTEIQRDEFIPWNFTLEHLSGELGDREQSPIQSLLGIGRRWDHSEKQQEGFPWACMEGRGGLSEACVYLVQSK